jgi:alpha-glucoside transport system substrate-binding protein
VVRFLLISLAAAFVALVLGTPVAAKAPEPVTVVGPYVVGTPDADALEAELSAFAAKKGFEVIYDDYFGISDLEARIYGPDQPDLIIAGQPGIFFEVADELFDLSEFVKPKKLHEAFGEYLIEVVTDENLAVLGAPIQADLKTLVWYKPAVFETNDYAIPATFAELVALSDRMVADGFRPWCNYIESGAATGWMGTDWVEDMLLGAEGPTVYDQWVDHTVPFTDPRVEVAFERYQQMIDTPGYVFDRANMLNASFWANVWPLDAGECLMHKQGSFFHFGFTGVDPAEFSTFKFPSVDPAFGDATMGGGTYVAALDDRKEVRKLTTFMLSDEFGETALAASGDWLLPNAGFDHAYYPNDLVRSWAATRRSRPVPL